ncbi:fucose permease [Kribbella antiqua]|uniref:Fucose permease n=1 Tax=Kribbella antiqua TaxID=2512217 RepID=A0A4R2INP1_9ACTN|nr:MFS transporter [Kribbella antiqua]TCO44325.1 fucose permease [Kribbella antiqua]
MTGRTDQLRIGVGLSSMGFLLTGLGACIAMLARDLNEPTGKLALLSSAFAVGLIVIAVVGPRLLQSWPLTTALRIGSLICAVGAVLLALAPTYGVAVAGGLCIGLGGALLVLVAPLVLRGPTAAARLSRVNAVASAVGILAPIAIGAVDSFGPTGRLALLAAVPPLVALAVVKGKAGAEPLRGEPSPTKAAAVTIALGWLRVVLAVGVEFCFVVWAVARLVAAGLPMATAALLGSAFPIGMAVGRAIGPIHWRGWSPVVPAGLLAIIGTLLVSLFDAPAAVTIGLVTAGVGVAPLYPVTLAALVATPGLNPTRLAAIGALASGTAILLTPAALAALARVADLRTAYLITIPLITLLITLSRRHRPADRSTRRHNLHTRRAPADRAHRPLDELAPQAPQND